MTVRPATESDIPTLLLLGADFAAWAGHRFDPEKVRGVLLTAVTSDTQVVLVYDVAGQVVGGLMGMLYVPWLIDSELWAVELAWWVDPTKRGSAGVRLLQAFEQWGRDHGAVSVSMSCFATLDSPASQLLARTGYKPTEVTHYKEIRQCQQ